MHIRFSVVVAAAVVAFLAMTMACAESIQAAAPPFEDDASDIQAPGMYAWFHPDCFLCYEGLAKDLVPVSLVDPVNPCRKQAKVAKGACASFGFQKRLGVDPVFKTITLWLKPRKHNLREIQ